MSADYIAAAQRSFRTRRGVQFRCQDIATLTDGDMPPCRYAIAMGVLHHLDDNVAKPLIDKVYDRLAPGGKLITLDPVYVPGQSRLAYEIIRHDRGQNVRTPEAYLQLLSDRYRDSVVDIRHDYFHIPYTLGIMTASRA
jgi:SAM-dependent methyltransferase